MVVAADRRQARQVMRFVRGLAERACPGQAGGQRHCRQHRAGWRRGDRGDHGVAMRCAATRLRAAAVDELAFWPTEDSATPDQAIIEAIRPAMLTIPNSLLICASSPYARRGALWDAYRQALRQGRCAGVWCGGRRR